MAERAWIVLGIVMVIIGVVGAIYAGPMEMRAQTAYAGGDTAGGESMRIQADTFRYGGLGLASVGLVVMAGSWMKYVFESSKRF